MPELLFSCTIPGRPYVKKNCQRTIGFGKRKRVIYSANFRKWNQDAILYMREVWKGKDTLDEQIEVTYRFYFKEKQSEADVSNLCEAPGDALKEAGIIKDDILIYRLIAEKYFYANPRLEIELRKYNIPPHAVKNNLLSAHV